MDYKSVDVYEYTIQYTIYLKSSIVSTFSLSDCDIRIRTSSTRVQYFFVFFKIRWLKRFLRISKVHIICIGTLTLQGTE